MRLDWQTPNAVYDELDQEFGFDFDPCPHDPQFDGLNIEWGSCNFVNPPYGREISKWIDKALEQFAKGKTVVLLVASRTDTKWWHKLMNKASGIRFIKGRLKFDSFENSAPFPSAIVVLDPKQNSVNPQKDFDCWKWLKENYPYYNEDNLGDFEKMLQRFITQLCFSPKESQES
jgi:site-specific DNA-methyltransferase (adenine-specific)